MRSRQADDDCLKQRAQPSGNPGTGSVGGKLAFLNKTYWPISDAVKDVGLATSRVAGFCSRAEDSGQDIKVRKRLTRVLKLPYVRSDD